MRVCIHLLPFCTRTSGVRRVFTYGAPFACYVSSRGVRTDVYWLIRHLFRFFLWHFEKHILYICLLGSYCRYTGPHIDLACAKNICSFTGKVPSLTAAGTNKASLDLKNQIYTCSEQILHELCSNISINHSSRDVSKILIYWSDCIWHTVYIDKLILSSRLFL